MKICGIISEYNPFHNGHKFHMDKTRRAVGEKCAIVCAMSGNFVQRGEPAAFEKHARAEAAVCCGADLVIEIPVRYVLSSAERYADGAVGLLNALGVCTHLSFGSECGDIGKLSKTAEILTGTDIDELIRSELDRGVSYAKARSNAVKQISQPLGELLESPNNTLAVEYLKALKRINSQIEPITIKRTGAGHDSLESTDESVSASYIRSLMKSGGLSSGCMPEKAAEIFSDQVRRGLAPVFMENMESAVLSKLRRMTEEDYMALPDGSEGLYRRLMRSAKSEPSVEAVISGTKTKRYTMSRIRRMVMCAYLDITSKDALLPNEYIHVLAFNDTGRKVLRLIKEKSELPVITKPASAFELDGYAKEGFLKGVLSTDLYSLAFPSPENRTGGRELKTSPVYVKQSV